MKDIDSIKNKIMCCDVLDGLKEIPDESVEFVVSSPPYNVNLKGYGNRDDNEPYAVYLEWLKKIFIECKRILVKGGRIAINIDAMTNRQEDNDVEYVRPIYGDLIKIGREIGLNFRTDICWYKQNAVGKKTAWGSWQACSNPIIRRNHEYILVWSKDDWRLDGDIEQSDLSKKEFEQWTFSTWFISPETRNLNGHPAPFPEELVVRLIKLFTYKGNTVVDPFMGTGTTGVVAKTLRRNYIGIDNSADDVDFATKRIANTFNMFEDDIPRSKRIEKEKAVKLKDDKVENEIF